MPIRSTPYSNIIKALTDARKSKGMKQVELAEMWEKTQPMITKIEQGERRLDVQEFLELCDLLGVDPTDLIRKAHNELKKELFANRSNRSKI